MKLEQEDAKAALERERIKMRMEQDLNNSKIRHEEES